MTDRDIRFTERGIPRITSAAATALILAAILATLPLPLATASARAAGAAATQSYQLDGGQGRDVIDVGNAPAGTRDRRAPGGAEASRGRAAGAGRARIGAVSPATSATAGQAPAAVYGRLPATPLHVANTFVVTTLADTGSGSLRAAISSANADPFPDLITFSVSGTISLHSPLPVITAPVIIDATAQAGYAGAPLVELDGTGAGSDAIGLLIRGGSSTVKGLAIHSFATSGTGGFGIQLDINGGNVVQGCYLGTNLAGTAAQPNAVCGIIISGTSSGNLIGGTTPGARNVISGNTHSGVQIAQGNAGHNVVQGNYIGLNAAGNAILANGANGIFDDAPDDTIGGSVPGAGNVISGNSLPGIFVGVDAPRVVVQGNYIGTDASGELDMGNVQNGIDIEQVPNNVIGDTTALGGNVFGGNSFPGIYLFQSSNNKIVGNYIGTDAAGSVGLSHGNGIVVDGAAGNVIGGTTIRSRNLISGNPFPGISMINGSSGNKVVGNYIGTNAAGTAAVPNSKGILINNCPNNVIGGVTVSERNVISGNSTWGIEIRGAGSIGTRVAGNYIGTGASGTTNVGNGSHGIVISSSQDTIGWYAGNTIAFNHGAGVYDSLGTGNLIVSNSMFGNTGLGIDLLPKGITPDDSLDGDAGPNGLQNFPILDSVVVSAGNTFIYGRLNSKPNARYGIDLYRSSNYNPSHFGEGETYIGGFFLPTDAGGNGSFKYTAHSVLPLSQFYTATATDTLGSTSEFSQCMCMADSDSDGILDIWETQNWGIDINSDGKIDLDLYSRGARPNHKDLFVEIDAMKGYAPPELALDNVADAFLLAPNITNPDGFPGIHLHYTLDDTTLLVQPLDSMFLDMYAIKSQWFGTHDERADSNFRYIRAAKRLVYRYGLWSRSFRLGRDSTYSGIATLGNGLGGQDFTVSLGGAGWQGTKDVGVQSGTFMHELGHTLGLRHGGGDDIQYKPNYYSVMNYSWQTPYSWGPPGAWQLDYSLAALDPLNESKLDELKGLNPPAGIWPIVGMPYTNAIRAVSYARLQPGAVVDWSGEGAYTNSVNVDINLVGADSATTDTGEVLNGYDDWRNLKYNFRKSPDWISGGTVAPAAGSQPPEMDHDTFARLNQLPPPKPKGHYVMDGKVDSLAKLVASNAGVNLWADYRNGQLYLATNSALSQAADMFLFVATARGALTSAPQGKAGQVGAWKAYLYNKASDNSAGWADAVQQPLTTVTVDTVGTVLEGVVDMELLTGVSPTHLYIAAGKYGSSAGGSLLAQAPIGNGDGNLDGSEYYDLNALAGLTPLPAFGGARVWLSAVRPNPVTAAAHISLSLPRAADVQVTVEDVQGRQVAQIAQGRLAAGEHELTWNGTTLGGRRVASGVYLFVVRTLGETHTAKMVLLK